MSKVADLAEVFDLEESVQKFDSINAFHCNHFSSSRMSPEILEISLFNLVHIYSIAHFSI